MELESTEPVARVTDGDPVGDSFIPEGVHVELPFPMLVGNAGPILLCGKVIQNKIFQAVAIDATTGHAICELGTPLTAPPHGEDIGQHWVAQISYICGQLKLKAVQKIKAGNKQEPEILVPRQSGLVTVGAL